MRLDDCMFVELSTKLGNRISTESSAISIDNNSKGLLKYIYLIYPFLALICFPARDFPAQNCEIFDGSQTSPSFPTVYSHHKGKLGMYNKQPTTVGSTDYVYGNRIVETFGENGWTRLADHPRDIHSHNLVGLDSGALLSIGRIERQGVGSKEYISDVWMLSDNSWTLIGNLPGVD